MKPAEKDIISGYLVKTGMPTDRVASLFVKNGEEEEESFSPDALSVLLQADAERATAWKAKVEDARTKGYDKAKAESVTKYENNLKTKLGVDSDKIGEELWEEIVAKLGKTNDLDAEKLKLHPEFIKLEKEWKKAHKSEVDTLQKQFEDFKLGVAGEKTFSKVADKFEVELAKLRPVLSKDPAKAKNQKSVILNELKSIFNWQENEGELICLTKEGKRFEDAHGNAVSFENLVKETAGRYLDFEDGEHHSSSGAENHGHPGGKPNGSPVGNKWKGVIPKTDAEFERAFAGCKTPEDRVALTKAYEDSQK